MNWIKVEDQLPELIEKHPGYLFSKVVLIYSSVGYLATAYRSRYKLADGTWEECWTSDVYGLAIFPDVTHWMALPNKPE